MNAEKNTSNAFADIENSESLITYLQSARRRNNIKKLHHYTTLDVAIKIIKDKQWHLCAPKNMNDLLEFNSGSPERWKNKLFSSLMGEDKESIAMWSMYGQPWERGVKISIPKEEMIRWLKSAKTLNEISVDNYRPTGHAIDIYPGSLKAIAIAYSNCHDTEDEGQQVLQWSNVTNVKYSIIDQNFGELTGYIKNKAWTYEKEQRIMFDQENEYERGSIEVPDYVIDSLTLTPSPLFEGDFSREIHKEIKRTLNIENSLFSQKLNIRTICAGCDLKQNSMNNHKVAASKNSG